LLAINLTLGAALILSAGHVAYAAWVPKSGGGMLSVTGTWLHDLHASNRMEGDYAVLTLAWQFGTSDN